MEEDERGKDERGKGNHIKQGVGEAMVWIWMIMMIMMMIMCDKKA